MPYPMIPRFSSNIKEIGHSKTGGDDVGELGVRFSDGGLWEYANVPYSIYESLLKAPSAGSYYHNEIKGKFSGRRVDEDK